MTTQHGPCIQLASGKLFDFMNCSPNDIDPRDIAAHLSKICRFTGATRQFYSVAQHSVHVSDMLPQHLKLIGLLHDATEAYINDMTRPLKRLNPDYVKYEADVLWPVIAERFGLPLEIPALVHMADNIVLMTERRDIMPPLAPEDEGEYAWAKDIPALRWCIHPLAPREAESLFKSRWKSLTGEQL